MDASQNKHIHIYICKITGPRRVMFNKIVNINHNITKFTSYVTGVVLNTCMIMCTNFGKKRSKFTQISLKNRMDLSSRTRAWLRTFLDLTLIHIHVGLPGVQADPSHVCIGVSFKR